MKQVVLTCIGALFLAIEGIDGYGAYFNVDILTGPALHAQSSYYIAPLKPGSKQYSARESYDSFAIKDQQASKQPPNFVCLWEQPEDLRAPSPWLSQPTSSDTRRYPESTTSSQSRNVPGQERDSGINSRIALGPNDVLRASAPPSRGAQKQPVSYHNPPSIPEPTRFSSYSPYNKQRMDGGPGSRKDQGMFHSERSGPYESSSKWRSSWKSKVKDQLKSFARSIGGSTTVKSKLRSLVGGFKDSRYSESSNRFDMGSITAKQKNPSYFSPFYNDFVPMTLDSQPPADIVYNSRSQMTSRSSGDSTWSQDRPATYDSFAEQQWSYDDQRHGKRSTSQSRTDVAPALGERHAGTATSSTAGLRQSSSVSKNGSNPSGATPAYSKPATYSGFINHQQQNGHQSDSRSGGTFSSSSLSERKPDNAQSLVATQANRDAGEEILSPDPSSNSASKSSFHGAFGSKPKAASNPLSGYTADLTGTQNPYGSASSGSSSSNKESSYSPYETKPKSIDNPLGGFAGGLAEPSKSQASKPSGESSKPSSYRPPGSKPQVVDNPLSGYVGDLTASTNTRGSTSSGTSSSTKTSTYNPFDSKPKSMDNPLGGYAGGLAESSTLQAPASSRESSISNKQPSSYSSFGIKPQAVDNPLSGYVGDLTGSTHKSSAYDSVDNKPKAVDNPLGGYAGGLAGPSNLQASETSKSSSTSTSKPSSYSAFGSKPKAVDNPFSGYIGDLTGQPNIAPSARNEYSDTRSVAGSATATSHRGSETSRESERMAWKSDIGRVAAGVQQSGQTMERTSRSSSSTLSDRNSYMPQSAERSGPPKHQPDTFAKEMSGPSSGTTRLSDRYKSSQGELPGAPKKIESKSDWMGLSTGPLSERYRADGAAARESTSWSPASTIAQSSDRHKSPSTKVDGASKSQSSSFSSGWTPGTRLSDRYGPGANSMGQGSVGGSTSSSTHTAYNAFGSNAKAVEYPRSGYVGGSTGPPSPIGAPVTAKPDYQPSSSYSHNTNAAVPMNSRDGGHNGYSTNGNDPAFPSSIDRDWAARDGPSSSYGGAPDRKPNTVVQSMRPVMEERSSRRDAGSSAGSPGGQWFNRDVDGSSHTTGYSSGPSLSSREPTRYDAATTPYARPGAPAGSNYGRPTERENEAGWSGRSGSTTASSAHSYSPAAVPPHTNVPPPPPAPSAWDRSGSGSTTTYGAARDESDDGAVPAVASPSDGYLSALTGPAAASSTPSSPSSPSSSPAKKSYSAFGSGSKPKAAPANRNHNANLGGYLSGL